MVTTQELPVPLLACRASIVYWFLLSPMTGHRTRLLPAQTEHDSKG